MFQRNYARWNLVMLSTDALDSDIITHLRTSVINFLPIQSLLSALKNPYC